MKSNVVTRQSINFYFVLGSNDKEQRGKKIAFGLTHYESSPLATEYSK